MKASFSYAVCYKVKAHCVTPLRTADAAGNTEAVLMGSDGCYMIQGSSLSGALRAWVRETEGEKLENRLFGSQNNRGRLVISDGSFEGRTQTVVRPRLRIDGRTGSAAVGGKFDLAHVASGSEFVFTVHWLGEQDAEEEIQTVERMLAALHSGEIRLGAQKNNGFGQVRLQVTKRCYDMYRAEDRERWLEDREDGQLITLQDIKTARTVDFTVSGAADSILVKAASAEHDRNRSYTPNMTEAGVPVIPGSSVKGAVRARAELIASFMGLPKAFTDELFGRMSAENDNGRAGKLRFEDLQLTGAAKQKISRIRINRFTGGVMRGGLFCEEPVSGGLTMRVSAPTEEKAGCMLLLYALRDLAIGLYNLGSGAAIGRGFLKVDEISVRTPEGNALKLSFDSEGHCSVSDPSGILPLWRQALEEKK